MANQWPATVRTHQAKADFAQTAPTTTHYRIANNTEKARAHTFRSQCTRTIAHYGYRERKMKYLSFLNSLSYLPNCMFLLVVENKIFEHNAIFMLNI